ncbi:hypothetical protein ACFL9U_07370 [Thermodesulfobacteriota bacterium]
MKKNFKWALVLGLAVVLVSAFALPGPAAAEKCGDGEPLIQGLTDIKYPLSCRISCEEVCRITTLPFIHSLQLPPT